MSGLTTEQRQQIGKQLTLRRAELCAEIRGELKRSGQEHFVDLADTVNDAGDASVADMLVDYDIAMVRRQVEELTQVEYALKRAAAEDFGICGECGADIGFARLKAYPIAIRCVACQENHEKLYQHEETPKL